MLIIKHRVNDLSTLLSTPNNFGIEVDVQFSNGDVFVGHDPGVLTTSLSTYLKSYSHKFLCINIKQEGVEPQVLDILNSNKVSNFFLFDLSFPSIMKMVRLNENKIALRISDLECIRDLEFYNKKIDWIWLDVFYNLDFLSPELVFQLRNFKLCLVSPELHTWRSEVTNNILLKKFKELDFKVDAICTKNSEYWINV